MQELEKILEEIEEKAVCAGYEDQGFVKMKHIREIIRKHMNDGWIPVEERLPAGYE